MPEGAFGGATGGATFDGVIKTLPQIENAPYSRERFIQECAMRIIAFSDFDKYSPTALVERAVTTAALLANRLKL